jgi:DNA segregation ATPase FtsK/SpoIIIE-like protein
MFKNATLYRISTPPDYFNTVAVDVSPFAFLGTQGEPDPLYEQAMQLVIDKGKPSISFVQRHLKIGYNRAARLMEDMEKAGIITSNGNGTYAIKS